MTTAFSSSSRLANFRQKKTSHVEEAPNTDPQFKLTLPTDQGQKSSYEPSSTFHNTRTSMRLLKGRIQRKQSSEKQDLRSTQTNLDSQQKLTLEEKSSGLKLVLNDSPQIVEKKAALQPPPKAPHKRIMIQKQTTLEEPQQKQKKEQKMIEVKQVEKKEQVKQEKKEEFINQHDQEPINKAIKEQDVQQSKEQAQNQTDLVLCPQGCGRKFNRKALQKHAKACKIVFMSKRKQFNSEAKRITSKQQANIVKQNKQKQKTQFGKTKSKGFEKTGDNWKAASEDFRSAIKAMKKEEENNGQKEENDQKDLTLVTCEYCEKKFADVLIQKHYENCLKKKEKENKKKTTKKK